MSLTALLGIGSAVSGFLSSRNQNKAIESNNALSREQLEYQKRLQAPSVAGALNYINNPDYYSKYQNAGRNLTDNTLNQLGGFNPSGYLNAGNEGVNNLRAISGAGGTQQQLDLANVYAYNPSRQQYVDEGVEDIRDAYSGEGQRQSNQSFRTGNFSSTAQAAADAQRKGRLGKDISRFRTSTNLDSYERGLDRASNEQNRQGQVASQLANLPGLGLGNIGQAHNIGAGAVAGGTGLPLLPYNQYNQVVSGMGLPNTQVQASTSPIGTAIGTGITAYGALKPSSEDKYFDAQAAAILGNN